MTDVPVDGAYNTLTLKNRQKTFLHLTNMKEIDNPVKLRPLSSGGSRTLLLGGLNSVSKSAHTRAPPWGVWGLASFSGSRAGEEEREPGAHCSRMRQVPLVTCILLRYTKINGNFCLPAERPHCRTILPVRHLRPVLKSETISLRRFLHRFVQDDR